VNLSLQIFSGIAYFFAAAVAAFLYHRQEEVSKRSQLGKLYLTITLVLCILAFMHLMNLGGDVADNVRMVAKQGGWYGDRRPMQAKLILFVTSVSAIGLTALLIKFKQVVRPVLPVILALSACVIFTIIKTISLHQIDGVLAKHVGPARLGAWIHLVLYASVVMSLLVKVQAGKQLHRLRLAR
jgi:hypothetical protein